MAGLHEHIARLDHTEQVAEAARRVQVAGTISAEILRQMVYGDEGGPPEIDGDQGNDTPHDPTHPISGEGGFAMDLPRTKEAGRLMLVGAAA